MKASEVIVAVILSIAILIGCFVLLFNSDKISAFNTKYENIKSVFVEGIGDITPVYCYTISGIGFDHTDSVVNAEEAKKFENHNWSEFQYMFTAQDESKNFKMTKTIRSSNVSPKIDAEGDCTLHYSLLSEVKRYPVTVEEKKDVFTVTYYSVRNDVITKDIHIAEEELIEKHIITVPKDRIKLIDQYTN